MEKDDIDGRKAAQSRQCVQPFWLASFHWLLDASGQPAVTPTHAKVIF
jgi:hypothetical protein